MLISEVWAALAEAGVAALPITADSLELVHEGETVRMQLHSFDRPLTPSDIRALVGRNRDPGLVVVPAATPAARETVERAGWSWVVTNPKPHGALHLKSGRVPVGGHAPPDAVEGVRRRPGRVPWGRLTLIRLLLAQPSVTQKQLAMSARVSQPRVSQILSDLVAQGLVARTREGWTAREPDELLRLWLDIYPGPGGISTSWYGLDAPTDQAEAAIALLRREAGEQQTGVAGEAAAVVSGDVAADVIAPWRPPVRAVVYARTGADLTVAGLTPAAMEDATLELIVPRDPGVWSAEPAPPGGILGAPSLSQRTPMPIADSLQVLWDVRRAPGPDSGEAAGRLWQLIRARHQRRRPGAGR